MANSATRFDILPGIVNITGIIHRKHFSVTQSFGSAADKRLPKFVRRKTLIFWRAIKGVILISDEISIFILTFAAF